MNKMNKMKLLGPQVNSNVLLRSMGSRPKQRDQKAALKGSGGPCSSCSSMRSVTKIVNKKDGCPGRPLWALRIMAGFIVSNPESDPLFTPLDVDRSSWRQGQG